MLIKNEINVEGIARQQQNSSAIMVILYMLSLFGCIFIVILLLKFIISCFFSDKTFCYKIKNNGISGHLEEIQINSSNQNSQTVTDLESIFLKVSFSISNLKINQNNQIVISKI